MTNIELWGKRLGTIAAAAAVLCVFSATADARTWKSANGKFSTQADFVELDADDNVILKNEDGETFPVPLAKLSSEDRGYVKRQAKKTKGESEDEEKKDKKSGAKTKSKSVSKGEEAAEAEAEEAEEEEKETEKPKKTSPARKTAGKTEITVESIEEELEAEIEKIEGGKDKADKKAVKINEAKIKAGEKILKHAEDSADRSKGYELLAEVLIPAALSGDARAEKKLRTLAEDGKKDKKLSPADRGKLLKKFNLQAPAAKAAAHDEDADTADEEAAEQPKPSKGESKVKNNLKNMINKDKQTSAEEDK
ncbi:MAG: hypothetical protein LBT89_05830 [Planctomycetaceae bacterium]|jgi:hypothetical protein|nr:hypothetical protein [Planctomycetaceae bacterium]